MKDLGSLNDWYRQYRSYPNGWDKPYVLVGENNIPPEYTACVESHHSLTQVNKGRCWNQYTCTICEITWDVDSSD